jgi:hypothetical protein
MSDLVKKRSKEESKSQLSIKKSKINQYFGCVSNKDIESNDNLITKEKIKSLIDCNDSRVGLIEKNSKSIGWDKFYRVSLDGKETDYAKCKSCPTVVKSCHSTGTSNLINHSCPAITVSSQSILQYVSRAIPQKVKTRLNTIASIASAKDLTTFSQVNKSGFKLLAQEFINIGSRYGKVDVNSLLPNERTVSRHADNVYEKLKILVIKELKNISAIGVTADHWVHENNKNSYLTLTVQYVMNATLKARVLATIITENKKTPTIKSDVRNIFQEFSIENTMKYFVTDNAIAMKSAFSNENGSLVTLMTLIWFNRILLMIQLIKII